jgi:hypothetical protein
MTYNFDPDRWYDNETAYLRDRLEKGELTASEYTAAREELDRRYEGMLRRLDGTYQLPNEQGPR